MLQLLVPPAHHLIFLCFSKRVLFVTFLSKKMQTHGCGRCRRRGSVADDEMYHFAVRDVLNEKQ